MTGLWAYGPFTLMRALQLIYVTDPGQCAPAIADKGWLMDVLDNQKKQIKLKGGDEEKKEDDKKGYKQSLNKLKEYIFKHFRKQVQLTASVFPFNFVKPI